METSFSIGSSKDVNKLIEENMGFIIKSVSGCTHRYISIENDDALSVGMMAFAEAVQKFDENRGNFYPFAKLVIESRVKSHLAKETKYISESFEEIEEKEGEFASREVLTDTDNMQEDIDIFKNQLELFDITLDVLVQCSPKHRDTRRNAVSLGERIAEDEYMTGIIYKKKKMPVKETALRYTVTEKFVKGNKKFIIAVMIVFYKKLRSLSAWIREAVR